MSISYLPFEKLHYAEITGLDPESLKASAKFACNEARDVEKIKHSTALNHIAKSLGIKGGWARYTREYSDAIMPFMQKNGLLKRQDILNNAWNDHFCHFYPEQISGRLFDSGRPLPDKMFIGDGLNYWDLLDLAKAHPNMSVGSRLRDQPVKIHKNYPPATYNISMNGGECGLHDAYDHANFLGDQYCEPNTEPSLARLYRLTDEDRARLDQAGEILSILVRLTTSGWAEVIPYNHNLIFLRLEDGRYDFFYRNMRSEKFKRNPFLPYLRDKDISKNSRSDDFSVWSYFQYKGWREQDEHLANELCLGTATKPTTHRDAAGDQFLKKYLSQKGRYKPEIHSASSRENYHYSKTDKGALCFSDLITVGQFKWFLEKNSDYGRHRKGLKDVEEFADSEYGHSGLPAAVTWYDALAYASWRRKEEKLPLKLLDLDQYLTLADGMASLAVGEDESQTAQAHQEHGGTYYDAYDKAYKLRTGKRPDYTPQEDFKKWTLGYNSKPLLRENSNCGLNVVRCPLFSEWLAPIGQAINAWGFSPPNDIMFADRYFDNPTCGEFAPNSNGKYKGMKIGFRLCYLVAEHGERA